jgi:ABC-type glycerol-3-phosphate transport system substrate-binding protein
MINKKIMQISRFDQILDHVRERIVLLEFPVGSKLPSERQLALDYQCSQATMNKVVSTLISDNLLERTEKRGAFVKRAKQNEIKFMGWMASEKSGVEVWDQLLDDFQDAQNNLKIDAQTWHYSEMQEELTRSAGRGEAPDLAQVSRNWTGHLASLGLLEPLEDKLSQSIVQDHLTWAEDKKHSKEELYSIDFSLVPMLLYVNCDILEQCGLASDAEPQNLAEFIQLIEVVNKAACKNDQGQDCHGFLAPKLSDEVTGQWFLPWLYAAGGNFFNAKGEIAIGAQEARETLISYKKCLKNSPDKLSIWDVRRLFEQGRSAFIIDGPRGEDFFKNSKMKIKVISLPKDVQGKSSSLNANHALSLFAQSENQLMGSKLIDTILNDSQLAELNYREQGYLPPRRSLLENELYQEPFAQLVLQEALEGRRSSSYLPCYQLAIGLLGHAISRALNGQAKLENVLEETAANIEYIMNHTKGSI